MLNLFFYSNLHSLAPQSSNRTLEKVLPTLANKKASQSVLVRSKRKPSILPTNSDPLSRKSQLSSTDTTITALPKLNTQPSNVSKTSRPVTKRKARYPGTAKFQPVPPVNQPRFIDNITRSLPVERKTNLKTTEPLARLTFKSRQPLNRALQVNNFFDERTSDQRMLPT